MRLLHIPTATEYDWRWAVDFNDLDGNQLLFLSSRGGFRSLQMALCSNPLSLFDPIFLRDFDINRYHELTHYNDPTRFVYAWAYEFSIIPKTGDL